MKSTFTYTGIRVKNLDESVEFYRGLLGMTLTGRQKLDATGGEVAGLRSVEGGQELELNFYPEGSKHYTDYVPGEGIDHLAFKVENLDEALTEAAKAGYPTVLDVKSGASRYAYVIDPNGIYVELFA